SGASPAPAPAGFAPGPDLGPGHALALLRRRGPQTVSRGCPESSRKPGSGLHRCHLEGGHLGRGHLEGARLAGKWRVRRGEIWTAAGGKDYAGKPRPVV